jgi:hypothetical protein
LFASRRLTCIDTLILHHASVRQMRMYDTSNKDLLDYVHLVYVKLYQTFRDVLADLPDGMADRVLLVVKLREFEITPDSQSLSRRQGCWTSHSQKLMEYCSINASAIQAMQVSQSACKQRHIQHPAHRMPLHAWLLQSKDLM